MRFFTVAYYQDQDGLNVLHNLAGVPEQVLDVNGDNIRVPELNQIGAVAFLSEATTLTSARLTSPSLRDIAELEVEPIVNALVFGNPPEIQDMFRNPSPIVAGEILRAQINSDHSGASDEYCLAWLTEGPPQAVAGEITSIRFTGSAALAVGVYVNTALSFTQTLRRGRYQIVGLRVRGVNLVMARLVLSDANHRPGVPAVNAIGDRGLPIFRGGGLGVWGEFHSDTPPTMDCLGITDTAQVGILDVIFLG